MTYRRIPFERAHLDAIVPQAAQERHWSLMSNREGVDLLVNNGLCFSGFDDDRLLGCAGLIQHWHGNAEAWFVPDAKVGRKGLLMLVRDIVEYLDEKQEDPAFRRIWGWVVDDFCPGHRLMHRLCFSQEGLMYRYDPHGNDCRLYARIA